jgi:hypothetical protein
LEINQFYEVIHQKLKTNAEKYLMKAATKSAWRARDAQLNIGDKVNYNNLIKNLKEF